MNRSTLFPLAVAVVAASVTGGCGDHPAAPSTPVPGTSTEPATVTVSGSVQDNVFRFLRDVRVEVADGPAAGTFTLTDEAGRFELSGPFGGSAVTFRATKEGYTAATSKSLIQAAGGCCLNFTLKSLVAPTDISGDYVLTFNADPTCPDFPGDLKSRTYTATVRPYSTNPDNALFLVKLSGASFLRTRLGDTNSFAIAVSGDYLAFGLDSEFNPVTEQLDTLTYLTLTGSASASVGSSVISTISMPFEGSVDYCVQESQIEYAAPCMFVQNPTLPRASCASKHHLVILARQ